MCFQCSDLGWQINHPYHRIFIFNNSKSLAVTGASISDTTALPARRPRLNHLLQSKPAPQKQQGSPTVNESEKLEEGEIRDGGAKKSAIKEQADCKICRDVKEFFAF